MTSEDLIAFEKSIADTFNRGEIRAPIHLSGGNEHALIEMFRKIRKTDWILGSWRMHYQCLLKGVPPDRLRADIIAGHSIALCYPEYRILSSAIVGGTLPIGVGIAMGIKRRGGDERVHVFLGDMTASTGAFQECLEYARCKKLPMRFIIEDNGLSVCSPTAEVWGKHTSFYSHVVQYSYKLPWPHSGSGKRIQF